MTLETKVKVKQLSYLAVFNVSADICDGRVHLSFKTYRQSLTFLCFKNSKI